MTQQSELFPIPPRRQLELPELYLAHADQWDIGYVYGLTDRWGQVTKIGFTRNENVELRRADYNSKHGLMLTTVAWKLLTCDVAIVETRVKADPDCRCQKLTWLKAQEVFGLTPDRARDIARRHVRSVHERDQRWFSEEVARMNPGTAVLPPVEPGSLEWTELEAEAKEHEAWESKHTRFTDAFGVTHHVRRATTPEELILYGDGLIIISSCMVDRDHRSPV